MRTATRNRRWLRAVRIIAKQRPANVPAHKSSIINAALKTLDGLVRLPGQRVRALTNHFVYLHPTKGWRARRILRPKPIAPWLPAMQ